MSSTTFVDQVTPIVASWLNDVNTSTYTTVPALSTALTTLSGTTLPAGYVAKDSSTGGATIPAGTTAQRGTASVGKLRYNTDLAKWEGYTGASWDLIASGFAAPGANADITSLTALTAGGLPDNSVLTNDIAALQVTGAKIAAATITADKLSGAQTGSAPIYGCRAWATFNGATTGTNAPTGGGNVSTVTRVSAGNYTVNFTTAMPDANYAVSAIGSNIGGGCVTTIVSKAVGSFSFTTTQNDNSAGNDPAIVTVMVVG